MYFILKKKKMRRTVCFLFFFLVFGVWNSAMYCDFRYPNWMRHKTHSDSHLVYWIWYAAARKHISWRWPAIDLVRLRRSNSSSHVQTVSEAKRRYRGRTTAKKRIYDGDVYGLFFVLVCARGCIQTARANCAHIARMSGKPELWQESSEKQKTKEINK